MYQIVAFANLNMRHLVCTILVCITFSIGVSFAKDKAVADQYPVILQINTVGKVVKVTLEDSVPKSIREKAMKAFLGKDLGVKRKNGQPIHYKQKLFVSTKHLIDNSQISQR